MNKSAVFVPLLPALALAAPQAQTTGWEEDVDTLLAAIEEIHPDPHRGHGPDDWASEARLLKEEIPYMEPHEAVLGLQRLLALADDGHTEPATLHPSLSGPWLPLLFRRFEDGWFVRTGHRDYADVFGKRIVSVAGVPIDEAARRLAAFVSGDNPIGKLDGIGNLLRDPAVLHAAGITDSRARRVEVAAAGRAGDVARVTVEATFDAWVTPEWTDADASNQTPKPLYRRMDGNYSFEFLADEAMAYVYFDKIRDEENETIEAFFGRVFTFVEQNEVDRFVLDLRENSGGNLDLNLPVLHGVLRSKIDRPGRFFVIIGRDTYSAAMNLAVLLERHTHALFVGEPTGATPNHFGDTRVIDLPRSGLQVEISELYWQNSDPRDARPWITPDLPATLTSSDFFAHRDPALEAIRDFAATPELAADFGRLTLRWQRANQREEAVWPGVVPPGKR